MLNRYRLHICALAMLIGSPVFANIESDESEAMYKFYDEMAKDSDLAKKPYRSSSYSYIPVIKDEKVDTMKVLNGNRKLLSVNLKDAAGDPFWRIWLVHPLKNTSDKSRRLRLDRSVYDVVGSKYSRASSPFVDINGDGKLELIVGQWTGGAHCCNTYNIYSLDKANHLWDSIDARDGTFVFTDINADGKVEAIGPDFTFAYWNTSFAGSPAGTVILRPGASGFEVATDLMRTPKPSNVELDKLAADTEKAILDYSKDYKSDDGSSINLSSELWKNMISLIYAGHSNEAWSLCRKAWPSGQKALVCNDQKKEKEQCTVGGPDEFIDAFLAKLRTSPYWNGLKALNSSDQVLNSKSNSKDKKAQDSKAHRTVMSGADACQSKISK